MTDSDARRAFEVLFRAHYDSLLRFAIRLVRSPAEAEELVQDVMYKVWERRDQLTLDGELKGYLFQSVRNHALNHLRRRRVEQTWQARQPAEEPSVEAEPITEDLSQMEQTVRRAIGALPDRCREVFQLSREHGLSYAQIAATMGISIKTVETQMGRALRALRIALAPLREI